MKQFYTILASALLCSSSAYAAAPLVQAQRPSFGIERKVFEDRINGTSRNFAKKAPARITAEDLPEEFVIITEAPEGELKHYDGASHTVYYGDEYDVSGVVSDITFTADGKAYWLNPLSNAPFDSYIVGDVVDDKITFKFPQPIYQEVWDFGDGYPFVFNIYAAACALNIQYNAETEETEVEYDFSVDQTMVFTINADGSITQEGDLYIAAGDWDEDVSYFYYDSYADNHIVLTPFNETAVSVPETAEFEDWVFSEDENDINDIHKYFVKVAFVDNDVYVKGICQDKPEITIKGTLADGKIVVPYAQYLGDAYYRHVFAMTGLIEWVEEDGVETGYIDLTPEGYVFNYDANAKKMTSANPDGVLFINEGKQDISYLAFAINPAIYYQGEISDYTPDAPQKVSVQDWMDWFGQILLYFECNGQTVNGDLISIENLSYIVYVDGEPFTFTTTEYQSLESDMTEIPYTFSDGYSDIQYQEGYNFHQVWFYYNTMQSIGIQLIYTDESGKKYYSETVTIDTSDLGVGDIVTDKTVVSEEYFDLSGRAVEASATGILVKRTTFSDGTVATSKIIKK